jgi:Tfp pilus assembly protein PilF
MKRSLLLVAALSLAAAYPAAMAAPGGGGGGLPPTSGPRVDPTEAFREGVEALQSQDYSAAEKKFGDVLSVAPKNPEANYYMALAKSGLGKPKQAVRYLQRAIKERNNFVEAREKLALLSIDLGDVDEARAQLAAIDKLKAECVADAKACDAPFIARVDLALARLSEAMHPKTGETPEDMVSDPPASVGEPRAEEADSAVFRQSLFF